MQSKKDKVTFGGLFQRGSIYDDDKDLKSSIDKPKERGEAVMDEEKKYLQQIDFDNPSASMVHEAANRGIDLKDPQVLQMLKQFQKSRETPANSHHHHNILHKVDEKRRETFWKRFKIIFLILFILRLLDMIVRKVF